MKAIITYFTCTILLITLLLSIQSQTNFSEQKFSKEELTNKITEFNSWYHNINPKANHLYAELDQHNMIRLHTSKHLQQEEVYITIEKEHMITPDLIYQTKYGDTLREIEEMYGYDDMTNLLLFVVAEFANPKSKWKPYLDLLPSQNNNLLHNFWNEKSFLEKELASTFALKQIVDSKLNFENKAKSVFEGIVKNHDDVFEADIFSEANLEWGLIILDTKVKYIEFSSHIIPMFDFVSNGQSEENPTRTFSPKKNENGSINIKAMSEFSTGGKIYENPRTENSRLLVSNVDIIENNYYDCFGIQVSFSQNKEDSLALQRQNFFGKYFLYDNNQFDSM